MSGNRVLVTGAAGYLGGRLMSELPGAQALGVDITDAAGVAAACAAAGPATALVHLAAANEIVCANDPARGFAVNCLGTWNVMEAAAAAGIRRVVFFSTIHVYGDIVDGATVTEDTLPSPLHPYGITKLAGEQLCRRASRLHGLELAIVRLSNGIGAPASDAITRWTLVLLDLCRQAFERGALCLRTSGVQRRDFIGIGDVAAAVRLLLAVDRARLAEPVFNLGSGASLSIRELAAIVQAEFAALYGARIPLSAPEHMGAPPPQFRYDTAKMMALGFHPQTDLARDVRETLRFCERFRHQDS